MTKTAQNIQISPSMMCADLWRLAEQVGEVENTGVDLLHFDLMDAHYVPMGVRYYVWEFLDFVLIMTVNPGYAGQKLVPAGLRKIADCRQYLQTNGLDIPIQIDGNVSFEHIPNMVAAGADCLVGGTSSVFHRDASIGENVLRTRQLIDQGLARRP